jgi:ATPase family associated with various cellular activities (AAA)
VQGFLKEIIVDRCIDGHALAENIVVVAACNPPRSQIQTTTRERDLGRTWASGHYQVSPLPMSLQKLKWSFGALSHSQEKEFIYRRMQAICGLDMPSYLQISLTEVVSAAHEKMRLFGKRNILASMRRNHQDFLSTQDSHREIEASERARSVVSLRDIQRVFSLYHFFLADMPEVLIYEEQNRSAMLLAVSIVYYLRLDASSREEFLQSINDLNTELGQRFSLLYILTNAMNHVVNATEIPPGIAVTRGLKENIFATLMCALSQTPLIIVGPPGSSKTLAVHITSDNANGSDSVSRLYSRFPRLMLFHYQCSKQSTSKEISAVFDQAIARQERNDATKSRCVVFMDEAGLPEEDKESLKVLHYLLENHMSAKAKVGFVAISNHILDAAKTNRCVMLLRQDPDDEEMLAIACGVLFDFQNNGHLRTREIEINRCLMQASTFAERLCRSYASLFQDNHPLSGLDTFFGLRDFIYLLKAIRSHSRIEPTKLITDINTFIYCIERNFNGITTDELHQISLIFVKPLAPLIPAGFDIKACFRNPMSLLKDALRPLDLQTTKSQLHRSRFKLVIDCTEDDSILRLLNIGNVIEVTKKSLYKLSNLPDNYDSERLHLVAGIKFAAMQGIFAVLSQTEPVNESFYDLFNQRFHEISNADGSTTMYANIAVGGISRRSLVQSSFECIVHVRESRLLEVPAPFLNRFEKYRLSLNDVLVTSWARFGRFSCVVSGAMRRTSDIIAAVQGKSITLCWLNSPHTLESVFVSMLPYLDCRIWNADDDLLAIEFDSSLNGLSEHLAFVLGKITSLKNASHHLSECLRLAQTVFSADVIELLFTVIQDENATVNLRFACNALLSQPAATGEFSVSDYLAVLAQMCLTRIATFRLIQLATPESIFANRFVMYYVLSYSKSNLPFIEAANILARFFRNELPSELIEEYFRQPHFSLLQFLSSMSPRENELKLTIVHTRSDHLIHMIPCLAADRASDDPEVIDSVRKLILHCPEVLVVENLNRISSERAIRTSLEAWISHESRDLYLMFVDMNQEESNDRGTHISLEDFNSKLLLT